MGKLITKRLEVGMLGTNCYIVMDSGDRAGFVIDPGAEARKILDAARSERLECSAILCTHGHVDHIGAVGKVAEALDAPVLIARADSGSLEGSASGVAGRLGSMLVSKPKGSGVDYLEPDSVLDLAGPEIRVVPTPGHTKGSMSFITGAGIFCGDLVFQGSVGRTDLRGGSFSELLESVRKYVWPLPDDTVIYPGHGPATTVAAEKARNPFLRDIGMED
jgi:hydroxyacylglutathione hydrolase